MAEDAKFEKVVGIVKAMNAEGLSVSDIKDSLKQIGVKDDDIDRILQKAAAEPTPKDIHAAVKDVEHKVAQPLAKSVDEHKDMTKQVKDKVEDMSLGMEEHAKGIDNLSSSFDEHKKKLDALHTSLKGIDNGHKELHSRVKGLSSLSGDIDETREMLLDLKAMLASIKDLNSKILETNKEMLMRLKTK